MNEAYRGILIEACKKRELTKTMKLLARGNDTSRKIVNKSIVKERGLGELLDIAEEIRIPSFSIKIISMYGTQLSTFEPHDLYKIIANGTDPGAAFKLMEILGENIQRELLAKLVRVIHDHGGYFIIDNVINFELKIGYNLSEHGRKLLRRKRKELRNLAATAV